MAETEVDLLGDAVAGTEKEIFGEGVNGIETEDNAGEPDRSLEEMDEAPGAEAADEGDDEGEGAEPEDGQSRDETGKFTAKDDKSDADDKSQAAGQNERNKGNPAVALREERTRRQTAEADRDAARSEAQRALADMNAKLELTLREIAALKQAPVQQPKAEEPKAERPDKFADPEGYDRWVEHQIASARTAAENTFSDRLINMSMAGAHERHGKAFEDAFQAVSSLDRSNPANNAVLRTIREAPNPGAALMRWHQQNQTLREVGGDPTAYRQRIAEETKSQLLQDPEFRQQLIAQMKAEAGGSNGGRPRTIIRTPPSLNGASGRGESQADPRVYDNSEKGVFESAFGD